MRIAILGTRGVPASYGGFETFAEQLGRRLVRRGHRVTVYGRTAYVSRRLREHEGMELVVLPAPRSKYLETVIHSLFGAVHAVIRRYDVVYVCNSANVPAVLLLLLGGSRVVLNVDGLEWQRAKWGAVGRAYYRLCAAVAARLPAEIVTDARVIQEHYLAAYGRRTTYFPYGTDLEPLDDPTDLATFGLEPKRYLLYVSRLEPENNAHVVIDAFSRVPTDLPLVIVGDAPYASKYIASLRERADERIRFLGPVYGRGYRLLRSHARLWVQATSVGGTHPALVEAMGYGNVIVANDVPEHRETLGEAGRYYRTVDELAAALRDLLADESAAAEFASAARTRARDLYAWDAIADAYDRWLRDLVTRRVRAQPIG